MNAEAAVLGGILMDGKPYWLVADLVTAEDFIGERHADLFDAIATLAREGQSPDAVLVADRYPKLARLAMELAADAFSSANIRAYAEAVAEAALWRRVQGAGMVIAGIPKADAYGEAQRVLATCAPRAGNRILPARDFLRQSIAGIQERFDSTEDLTGVPCGIDDLDAMTCGWQPGDMIVLAARPSVGKTAFAIQCALHAAQSVNVLFFSLEMSGSQVTDRAIANIGQIQHDYIRRPKLMPDAYWPRVTTASHDLSARKLFIDDSAALTVEAMAAKARQVDHQNRLGLIVVDYLSYMTPPRANSTNDAIQMMTRAIKATAKQLRVPIMLLCQLNRDGDGEPALRHLRDSGAVEQDADAVVFLWQPDEADKTRVMLKVAKQRNGPCGVIPLYADRATQSFQKGEVIASAPAQERGFRRFKGAGNRGEAA